MNARYNKFDEQDATGNNEEDGDDNHHDRLRSFLLFHTNTDFIVTKLRITRRICKTVLPVQSLPLLQIRPEEVLHLVVRDDAPGRQI